MGIMLGVFVKEDIGRMPFVLPLQSKVLEKILEFEACSVDTVAGRAEFTLLLVVAVLIVFIVLLPDCFWPIQKVNFEFYYLKLAVFVKNVILFKIYLFNDLRITYVLF